MAGADITSGGLRTTTILALELKPLPLAASLSDNPRAISFHFHCHARPRLIKNSVNLTQLTLDVYALCSSMGQAHQTHRDTIRYPRIRF
jgi:hypothetical protein